LNVSLGSTSTPASIANAALRARQNQRLRQIACLGGRREPAPGRKASRGSGGAVRTRGGPEVVSPVLCGSDEGASGAVCAEGVFTAGPPAESATDRSGLVARGWAVDAASGRMSRGSKSMAMPDCADEAGGAGTRGEGGGGAWRCTGGTGRCP